MLCSNKPYEKKEQNKGQLCWEGGQVANSKQVVRLGLTVTVTLKQRLRGGQPHEYLGQECATHREE